jgi:hypothetical protein
MASVQDNFTIDAGGKFTRQFIYKVNGSVVNLTGYVGKGQIRKSTFAPLVFEFIPTITPGTYVINATLTPEQTRLLRDSNYVYAIEVYNNSTGDLRVVNHGVITVNQRIVR